MQNKNYSLVLRASEVQKLIQTYHKMFNFSKESLPIANISSICIISFTVETHKAKEGGTSDYQNRRISFLAAERKKRSKLLFWVAIEPGSTDSSATSGEGCRDALYSEL